jgi:hypothetical protein
MSSLTDGAWPHPSGGLCKMYVLRCGGCGYRWSQFIRFKTEEDIRAAKFTCHTCHVDECYARLIASRKTE